jgi:antitoxin component of MazEF toxin-antitoxin module
MKMQVAKCKDSLFLVLPNEVVAELGWGHGDIVDVSASGARLLAERVMTSHEHTMQIAREVMNKYRETFEALAKS